MKRIIFNELKRPFALMTVATMIFGGYLETSEGMISDCNVRRFFDGNSFLNEINMGQSTLDQGQICKDLVDRYSSSKESETETRELIKDQIRNVHSNFDTIQKEIGNNKNKHENIKTHASYQNFLKVTKPIGEAALKRVSSSLNIDLQSEENRQISADGIEFFSIKSAINLIDNISTLRNEKEELNEAKLEECTDKLINNCIGTAVSSSKLLLECKQETQAIDSAISNIFQEELNKVSCLDELLAFVNDFYDFRSGKDFKNIRKNKKNFNNISNKCFEAIWDKLSEICKIPEKNQLGNVPKLNGQRGNNARLDEKIALKNMFINNSSDKGSLIQFMVTVYIAYASDLGDGDALKAATLILASPHSKIFQNQTKGEFFSNYSANIRRYIDVLRSAFLNHISKHWVFHRSSFNLPEYMSAISGGLYSGFAVLESSGNVDFNTNYDTNNTNTTIQNENCVNITACDNWKTINTENKLLNIAAAEQSLDIFLSRLKTQQLQFIAKDNKTLEIVFDTVTTNQGSSEMEFNFKEIFGNSIKSLVIAKKTGDCASNSKFYYLTKEVNEYNVDVNIIKNISYIDNEGKYSFACFYPELAKPSNVTVYFSLTMPTSVSVSAKNTSVIKDEGHIGSYFIKKNFPRLLETCMDKLTKIAIFFKKLARGGE